MMANNRYFKQIYYVFITRNDLVIISLKDTISETQYNNNFSRRWSNSLGSGTNIVDLTPS